MPSSKRRMDSSREVSPLSSRSTTRSNRFIASLKESASRSSCFFSMGSLIGQCLPSPHLTINSPVGKPYPDQVSGLHLRDGLDQSVFPVAVYERISPAHHFERTETVQLSDPVFPKGAAASQKMDHPRRARPLQPPQPLPEGGDPLRRAAGCQAGNQMFQLAALPIQAGPKRPVKVPCQLIQPLILLLEPHPGMSKGRAVFQRLK